MQAATKNQWVDFWKHLGATGDALQYWNRLEQAYSENWRAYHNLRHIGHCLAEFAEAKQQAKDPNALEAAIWFHDAVYDTHAKDSEERSADLAREVLTSGGLPADFVSNVTSLILATKHNHAPTGHDDGLMVDIDLSILGQDSERYARFEKEIRDEYSWVSPLNFAIGRTAVLNNFLTRKTIYNAAPFIGKYEAQARRNLAWAITRLGEQR